MACCSWVSSPLAVSLLLRACGRGPTIDKYAKLCKHLAKERENQLRSKIFIAASTEEQSKLADVDSQRVDFQKDAGIIISDWIKEHAEQTVDIKHMFPSNTAMVLTNMHRFKDTWKGNSNAPRCMKVYNSFNYTQDVKYETRILELPTSEDFKLVLLVPNEIDVLPAMFSKLCYEGLDATVGSIQPVFTTTTRLEAPSMSFSSNIVRDQELYSNSFVATGLHCGNMIIDNDGISMNVLTCLYSTVDSTANGKQFPHTNQNRPKQEPTLEDGSCFYFALITRDTPLFIGQYYP